MFRIMAENDICLKKMKYEGGYTLAEMLIVLSIFILIYSVSWGLYPRFMDHQETRQFLTDLNDDILYAQQYAISHQAYTSFAIDSALSKYQIYTMEDGIVKSREIPHDIDFVKGTMNLIIYFTSNGNVSIAGAWFIFTPDDTYKLTLNIGKGRFRIEKL